MKSKSWLLGTCALLVLFTGSGFRAGPRATALEQPIYLDGLGTGWVDWSWGVERDLAAASPVHTGSHSLRVAFSGGWSGLYLHKAGVETAGLSDLSFYIHGGGTGGQAMNVFLYLDQNGDTISGPGYALSIPAANAWSEIRIPLSTLNPDGLLVTGLVWQDSSGGPQPAFYLDDIRLASDEDPNGPQLSNGFVAPRSIPADGRGVLTVRVQVSDPQGAGDIAMVTLDASHLGRGTVNLHDDGRSNDGAAGDGVYGAAFTPAQGAGGETQVLVTAQDQAGHTGHIRLGVIAGLSSEPGGSIPAGLPQRLGWGSNQMDWQETSGVPWDYVYQYITWGWESWGDNFVERYVNQAREDGYVPVITVYLMLGVPPQTGEGGQQYAQKLQNASTVANYLASFQRALVEARGAGPVIFALEPDFYGFMQQLSNSSDRPAGVRPNDPSSYPVALNKSGYPNNLAGFGRYLVDLVHSTAPNLLAAPMASMWATNADPQGVTASQAVGMAQTTAAFIGAMGGEQADLLVVEWSDRDAGRGIRPWWDDTDLETPRPTRAILWENALSVASEKRLLLWQVPVGNMSLDNSSQHYRDNRAAYAFSHPQDLFEAGILGVVFGGGDGESTQVNTDGGFVAAQGSIAYAAPAAPDGLALIGPVSGIIAGLRWHENSEPDLWGYRIEAAHPGTGQTLSVDAGRRNSFGVLLPVAGEWTIRLRAYDAMGNLSQYSSPVTVTTLEDASQIFLPLIRH